MKQGSHTAALLFGSKRFTETADNYIFKMIPAILSDPVLFILFFSDENGNCNLNK